MSRSREPGISSVIGTAIALAIVFTIMIPLTIYIQSLQTLFIQEASRRLQYELERVREALEVHVAVGPNPEAAGLPAYLIIKNPGALSVSIPTVYVDSALQGVTQEDVSILVAPGETVTYQLSHHVSTNPPDTIRVKVVTLRGNAFYSEVVNPQRPPYMLIVNVGDMTPACSYKVEVSVIGGIGCVVAGLSGGGVCGPRATYALKGQEFGGSGVAGFMVAPGRYGVSLMVDCPLNGGCEEVEPAAGYLVDVSDHTVVDFTARDLCIPSKLPLRLVTPSGDLTTILSSTSGTVKIPFTIQLGNLSEPLKDVGISMTITTIQGLMSASPTTATITLTRLSPGESYSSEFTIAIADNTNPGGRVNFNIQFTGARGELTGKSYKSADVEKAMASGVIIVCRLNKDQYAVCGTS